MSRSSMSHLFAWLGAAAIAGAGLVLAAQAQTSQPADAKLTSIAYEEIKAGKYAEAVGHLRTRIKAVPNDGNAVFLLAVARNRLRQFAAAAHDLAVYLRHGGKNPEAAYEYGAALLGARADLALATTELEAYRQANPQSAKANLALGRAYFAAGRLDDAEAAFKAARNERATRPSSLLWLAMVEAARKNEAAAHGYLDELVKIAPNGPEVALLKRTAAPAKGQKP